MWDKLQKKSKRGRVKNTELYYATHYHLIPLYIISGLLIVAVLLMGCYMRYMWMQQDAAGFHQIGMMNIQSLERAYLPSVINPADKKQYIYPVSLRFITPDPYQQLRYSYDPGSSSDPKGASIGVTTSDILSVVENPLRNLGPDTFQGINEAQLCSKLYVIRFRPGTTQYGGFSPLASIVLKDGRTAYIHKNTNCLNEVNDNKTIIQNLESTLKTVESY